MTDVYNLATIRARIAPTWRLRYAERRYRRCVNNGSMDHTKTATWVAYRDELRNRGKRVPAPEAKPIRWLWWT